MYRALIFSLNPTHQLAGPAELLPIVVLVAGKLLLWIREKRWV